MEGWNVTEQALRNRGRFLSRILPDRDILVVSSRGAGIGRVTARQQLAAGAAGLAIVAWAMGATGLLLVDRIEGAGAQAQLSQEHAAFETRLAALVEERNLARREAETAREGFARAVAQIGTFQDRLTEARLKVRELEAANATLERTVALSMNALDSERERLAEAAGGDLAGQLRALERQREEAERTVRFLSAALAEAAEERDAELAEAQTMERQLAEIEQALDHKSQTVNAVLDELESAVTLAMEPLGTLFTEVGLPPEQILDQIRAQYSGQGGPLTAAISTKSPGTDPETTRATAILSRMDDLNLYRIAVEQVPFALPVDGRVRQTSGFGYRRDPLRGGTRLHAGMDWAGPHGTPIMASADGVVVFAGWQSGYGRLVKIRHAFGIETRFAHLAKINVRVGQRVSRGEKIGAMGNSGRSTGTHLHYEVRVGGEPVNPMRFIKAARDVL